MPLFTHVSPPKAPSSKVREIKMKIWDSSAKLFKAEVLKPEDDITITTPPTGRSLPVTRS